MTTPITSPGIILAEDAGQVRTLPAALLEAHGFTIWETSTGEEVIAHLQAHPDEIHAALLDVDMPGMGGPPALLALRQVKPDLRCCLMSGDMDACRGLGADCVMTKPFTLAQVQECVRTLLGWATP